MAKKKKFYSVAIQGCTVVIDVEATDKRRARKLALEDLGEGCHEVVAWNTKKVKVTLEGEDESLS